MRTAKMQTLAIVAYFRSQSHFLVVSKSAYCGTRYLTGVSNFGEIHLHSNSVPNVADRLTVAGRFCREHSLQVTWYSSADITVHSGDLTSCFTE